MKIRPKTEPSDAVVIENEPTGAAAGEIPPDLVAELGKIERDAAGVDGQAQPDQDEQTPGLSNAENIQGALTLAKEVLTPLFAWWPEFDRVWSDDQVAKIGHAGGLVCDKHGWNFGGALAQYGPYLALGIATLPPLYATREAIVQAKAAAAAAARERGEVPR